MSNFRDADHAGRCWKASMAVEPSTASSLPDTEKSDTRDDFLDIRMPTMSSYTYPDSESSDEEQHIIPPAKDGLPVQQRITHVQDAIEAARQKLANELDCMDRNLWNGILLDDLLSHIAAERLARMPHSGSSWDRTLRDAESFAVHISQFHIFVKGFLTQSSIAAELIWANSRLLLEVCLQSQSQFEVTDTLTAWSKPGSGPRKSLWHPLRSQS